MRFRHRRILRVRFLPAGDGPTSKLVDERPCLGGSLRAVRDPGAEIHERNYVANWTKGVFRISRAFHGLMELGGIPLGDGLRFKMLAGIGASIHDPTSFQ